jgi:hypothetical protein
LHDQTVVEGARGKLFEQIENARGCSGPSNSLKTESQWELRVLETPEGSQVRALMDLETRVLDKEIDR